MTIADTLREEGRAEGLAEGIHFTKLEGARKMLARGCDWDFVTEITGIRPEDLDETMGPDTPPLARKGS